MSTKRLHRNGKHPIMSGFISMHFIRDVGIAALIQVAPYIGKHGNYIASEWSRDFCITYFYFVLVVASFLISIRFLLRLRPMAKIKNNKLYILGGLFSDPGIEKEIVREVRIIQEDLCGNRITVVLNNNRKLPFPLTENDLSHREISDFFCGFAPVVEKA